MTDKTPITRREWFRLGSRRRPFANDQSPNANTMGQSQEALQPIAHPENHDGLDLSQIPPIREAMLSAEQVRQLCADIAELAENILLMRRTMQTTRAVAARATSTVDLIAARDALLNGMLPRLQIRYRWQNADWIDTLETRDSGFRLVRIAHRNASEITTLHRRHS